MQIDIGIAEPNRKEIAAGLSRLLADSFALYLKPTTSTGTSPAPCSTRCM
jgi:DNA-binding ferritin-like protein